MRGEGCFSGDTESFDKCPFEFGWQSAVKVNRRTGPDIDHRTSHGRPSSSLSPLLSLEPRTDLIAPNNVPKS
jgi:hypothetical protein